MNPSQAKAWYGATHYLPSVDDANTPTLYYKRKEVQWNDGTITNGWHYLSFAHIWLPSEINGNRLIKIVETV